MQAGLSAESDTPILTGDAYHINQRNEGIDLGGVSGALMHTQNIQMQTFVTQPDEPVAFAANQRDEVRDLHDVAGALGVQPNGAPAKARRSGLRGERSRSGMSELSCKTRK